MFGTDAPVIPICLFSIVISFYSVAFHRDGCRSQDKKKERPCQKNASFATRPQMISRRKPHRQPQSLLRAAGAAQRGSGQENSKALIKLSLRST